MYCIVTGQITVWTVVIVHSTTNMGVCLHTHRRTTDEPTGVTDGWTTITITTEMYH